MRSILQERLLGSANSASNVQIESDAARLGDARPPQAIALRRLPATLLDRDALERFLERAAQLLPPGDASTEITIDDGAHGGSFPTLRDLAADPDLGARLSGVAITLVRRDGGVATHELHLASEDGRATLSAIGDYLWAHGSVSVLADLLAVYARPQMQRPLERTVTINYFSAGVTLATALGAGFRRGGPAAVATALTCGAVWFLLDMALSELRIALTPPPPPPLAIEIRSRPATNDSYAERARLWLVLRVAAVAVWCVTVALIYAVVLPHVPKVW